MFYHCTHIVAFNFCFYLYLRLLWLGKFLSSMCNIFHFRAPWYNILLSNAVLLGLISIITGAAYILRGLFSTLMYLLILLLGYIKFSIWVVRLFVNKGILLLLCSRFTLHLLSLWRQTLRALFRNICSLYKILWNCVGPLHLFPG